MIYAIVKAWLWSYVNEYFTESSMRGSWRSHNHKICKCSFKNRYVYSYSKLYQCRISMVVCLTPKGLHFQIKVIALTHEPVS